jgi:hypothetical protein
MSESTGPSWENIGLSYFFVALAVVGAWLIYTKTDPGPLVIDADAFTVFAPFYIAAQAIERVLEPLAARWKNTTEEKVELKSAKTSKAMLESFSGQGVIPSAEQVEAAQADVEAAELALSKAKAERAIPLWALASIFGLLICSALGLGLISAISTEPPTGEFVRTVDILITGLAIGAGTKPLHDLISRLEKSKEKADPTTAP